MNKEERELEKWGSELSNLSVPSNLDDYVRAGIERGSRSKKSLFQSNWFRSAIAVAAVIILFMCSVRLSPAFAKSMSDVPVLSYLVHLINGDPSVQEAVKNNYIQKLGLSETHGETTITLDSMVADRHRMVIFYKVESDNKKLAPFNPMLYGAKGKSLPVGIGYEPSIKFENNESTLQEIDIDLIDCKDSQLTNPVLKIQLHGQTWTFKLPYDIQKVSKQKSVYPVHQTVSLEGQKITFNSVTVYPTGIAVDVNYDPANTKQITHFDDLRLVDDQGKVYAAVKNGLVASGAADSNHQLLFLESNYFTQPKSLHLELTSARAIDKKEQDVVVSIKDKKLLRAPRDHQLSSKMISAKEQSSVNRVIEFRINLPKTDVHQDYQMLDLSFKDGTGKVHIIRDNANSGPDSKHPFSDIQFFIPIKESYKDPLTFHLIDYPTRIYGKVDLKLK